MIILTFDSNLSGSMFTAESTYTDKESSNYMSVICVRFTIWDGRGDYARATRREKIKMTIFTNVIFVAI